MEAAKSDHFDYINKMNTKTYVFYASVANERNDNIKWL